MPAKILPLRLRRGGSIKDASDKDVGGKEEESADGSTPAPTSRPNAGPLSCKERGRAVEKDQGRRSRDWNERRRIISGSNEEKENDALTTQCIGTEVRGNEDYSPTEPSEIQGISMRAKEVAQRALERSSSLPRARITAISTLDGSHKIRLVSPGVKRCREEEEDGDRDRIETEGQESGQGSGTSRASSPGPSTDVKKKRKRGRPALTPDHGGQFTVGKIRERKKERESERLEEQEKEKEREEEQEIWDPDVRATSARAESVRHNALIVLDELRAATIPELTDLGLREVEVIKKVASTSKNMKGAFVGALWRAAENITALNLAYAIRLQELRGDAAKEKMHSENERSRAELSNLRAENVLLRGQNRELRAQVADGLEHPPSPLAASPTKTSLMAQRKSKGGRGGVDLPDTSIDTGEDETLSRALSPVAWEAGRKARREVREDQERGTLPPVIRPALGGKSKILGGGSPFEGSTPSVLQDPAPPPREGLTAEEVVRLITATIAQKGISLQLGGKALPTPNIEGVKIRAQVTSRTGKDVPLTLSTSQVEEGKGGRKKRKKRKKKKGGGSHQGAHGPKGTAPPSTEPALAGPSSSKESRVSSPLDRASAPGGETSLPPKSTTEGSWVEVVKKTGKAKAAGNTSQKGGNNIPPNKQTPETVPNSQGKGQGKEKPTVPKGPRGAAVTLTCPEGRYAEMMTAAREGVNLGELGISGMRTRRAITGALVLEIPGQDGPEKAENLREKLAELFVGRGDFKPNKH